MDVRRIQPAVKGTICANFTLANTVLGITGALSRYEMSLFYVTPGFISQPAKLGKMLEPGWVIGTQVSQ